MSETRKVVSGGAGTVAGLAKAKSMKGDKDAKESEGTFFGRRPPPEVQQLITLFANEGYSLTQPLQRAVISTAHSFVLGNGVDEATWQQIIDKTKSSILADGYDQLRIAFAAASTALKIALKQGVTADVFTKDLTTLLMPPTFVADIQQAFNAASREWEAATERYNDKEQLSALALVASRWQPPLRWRVDVTISTSQLQKVLVPAFLVRLKDKSGKERTFEVNPAAFHRLRYQVARVLKEFDTIEKLPILKIDKQSA